MNWWSSVILGKLIVADPVSEDSSFMETKCLISRFCSENRAWTNGCLHEHVSKGVLSVGICSGGGICTETGLFSCHQYCFWFPKHQYHVGLIILIRHNFHTYVHNEVAKMLLLVSPCLSVELSLHTQQLENRLACCYIWYWWV
jgi:hypothetical protein